MDILYLARMLQQQSKPLTIPVTKGTCSFKYVNLNRKQPNHSALFAAIDQCCQLYNLTAHHCRLSYYGKGDYCGEHVDTIPNIKYGVCGIISESVEHLKAEVIDVHFISQVRFVVFDPFKPHRVTKVNDERIVLIFWMG